MDDFDPDQLEALLAEVGERPLGEVTRRGRAAGQQESSALSSAVDNLLTKAEKAALAGDEERVQRLVGRIVDLPFDEHEDVQPGNLWADVRVFSTLVDFLEDVVDVDGDETEWLDCVRQVFDRLDPGPRGVLQRVLADLAVEAGWRFELKNVADEVRRLAGDIPSGFPEPMPTEELRVFVRNAVTVNLALDAAIDEATADWD